MSYYNDHVQITSDIQINGVSMPETSEPVKITFNNVSDGGRLADNIDFEGTLKGVKVEIELTYAMLNKEHYDILFNATQGAYLNGGSFFMTIKVPTYTPLGENGIYTFQGYFNSQHTNNCTDTTEKHEFGAVYQRGGNLYDELHEDVVFKFVQK